MFLLRIGFCSCCKLVDVDVVNRLLLLLQISSCSCYGLVAVVVTGVACDGAHKVFNTGWIDGTHSNVIV